MSKQDRQGARTPADVERRFYGSISEVERAVKQMDSEIAAELSLKIGANESGKVISMINASADTITIKGNRLTIESTNFELTQDGTVKAKAGEIGGCSIVNGKLQIKNANIGEKLTADQIDATNLKVKVANVDGLLNVDGKIGAKQINADGMDIKKATIGSWHLAKTQVPISATSSTEEYALYTDEIFEENGDRDYTYRVYLTAKGVYVAGLYDTSNETGVPYFSSKTWLEICES